MSIQKLGARVKAERRALKALEAKSLGRHVQAKAAKARARAAKLEYKTVRAEAKKAKRRLRGAKELVENRRRRLEKAEKALAWALRQPPVGKTARKPAAAAARRKATQAPIGMPPAATPIPPPAPR